MGRKLLAVCDSEPVYAKSLMEQICRKGETSWQIRVFSDAGQLFQYSKKQEIDLLLMDESYPEELRNKIQARKRLLLFRESPGHFAGSEKGIFKYQSARQIEKQLFQELSAGKSPAKHTALGLQRKCGRYSDLARGRQGTVGKGQAKLAVRLGGSVYLRQ